ncbi:hypothetical protein BT63DRAFT_467491 [Microthyrium microscopicum]|uniref:lytic cellulose monooxygenase (C4-dehydrogenating) n=1 Tax=Microthyrium microscopicum TaxID=703497 RepID=A0A6A6USJ0_9PEZI|nr:hypothetical protein BT63DRAFT_467491 [Microthyrium microscopicum]
MRSFLVLAGSAGLAAAHGILDGAVVDGTYYPMYDPRLDNDYPGIKRITWGYPKTNAEGTGPVEQVASKDIACRFGPLVEPKINAVARAGSKITFEWTPWFGNHRGPVLTYMGLIPDEKTTVNDVNFFKIDELGYDKEKDLWGTDDIINNNSTRTVTIPSDIKPGMYAVRTELIGLHFSWRENKEKKTSGAQLYPTCIKVQVTGSGTATPPGVKFPGAYNWRDPGILVNIHYGPKRYITPGPAVYKGERNPPEGPVPVVKETGEMTGEEGKAYSVARIEHGKQLLKSVANDIRDGKTGLGGCFWEDGADPSTVKCTEINPTSPGHPYVGYAQPVNSPGYTETPGSAMKGNKPPPASYGNENGPNKRAVEFTG